MQKTVTENLLAKNSAGRQHYFALCESCFWSATILMIKEDGDVITCPMCTGSNSSSVSLIPLAMDEEYRISFGLSAGLELSFSKRRRSR